MKYIGPFLRINSLSKSNIENQLFHLSKEAIKHIVFHSKCGIALPIQEIKSKNISNIDISTFNSFSPLLCIYKKASPKLILSDYFMGWDEESFKKEIPIRSNAFMTLSLLELYEYYKSLEDVCYEKKVLGDLYLEVSRRQLEFYASYLRSEEGVFIDKTDLSSNLENELVFEAKNKKYYFSDQALLMAAYYKYASLSTAKDAVDYRNFALDILNMFLEFKDDLYLLSYEELLRLSLALNIFYEHSKLEKAKSLLLDISDFILENHMTDISIITKDKLDCYCMLFLNLTLLHENLSISKFRELADKIAEKLLDKYNPEVGIFVKDIEKKEVEFSCDEIALYLLAILVHSKKEDADNNDVIIIDIFKRQLISSGIILSWPDAPNIDDIERYSNFSLKAEDLMDEQNFKMATISSPENSEYAPIFIKTVTYNRKKEIFKQNKLSFDSGRNMFIFYLLLHFLRKDI